MLDKIDQQIIHKLVFTNETKSKIMEGVGLSRTAFYARYKKPEFQDALNKRLNESFKVEAAKAKQVVSDLLNSPNEKIRLKAAVEILNKAGYKEVQKTEIATDDSIKINITGNTK